LEIYRGAGAFVGGEGSALTSSVEGKRGTPRVKRFRTVAQGLFEKPTLLNNVKTFANIPLIINNGAAWYQGLGPATNTEALQRYRRVILSLLWANPIPDRLRELAEWLGIASEEGLPSISPKEAHT
jgi:NADH-quinone oxidoreductase subunit F